MSELDNLYCRLLHLGMIVLQEAAHARDLEWLLSELEMLHNIPSLVGETNGLRHEYYWKQERDYYIEKVTARAHEEQIRRMRMFYEPIWQEMEPLMSPYLT